MEAWATWGNQSGSFRPWVRPSSSPAAHTWFSTQRHKHRTCLNSSDSQTHSSHRRTISPHVFIKILMVLHTHGTHLTCTADTHIVHHTTTDSEVSHTHSCLRPLTLAATGRGRAFKFPHNAGPNVPHCSRIHKPPHRPGTDTPCARKRGVPTCNSELALNTQSEESGKGSPSRPGGNSPTGKGTYLRGWAWAPRDNTAAPTCQNLEVYTAAFRGFSHRYRPDGVTTPGSLKAASLERGRVRSL